MIKTKTIVFKEMNYVGARLAQCALSPSGFSEPQRQFSDSRKIPMNGTEKGRKIKTILTFSLCILPDKCVVIQGLLSLLSIKLLKL